MAENDNDKTTTYGNSENNKTETYGNSENQKTTTYKPKQDETAAYSDLQKKDFKSRTHGIGVGDRLELKGKEYLIVEVISEGTGEATIFKIEDGKKNTYALKLYFEFTNHKEEPNDDTLHRIKDITDPDILRLYDFGVGVDKYLGKHCFEISDFAKGGNLFSVSNFIEKYKPEFIEKHVVKEIYLGIIKLHENKIYHCDLKPQNVFYLDKNQTDLVIGDYGSAKAYDLETEKELRKSSTVKGTDAYLPPEQARGIISEKNDYYSFGMILLNLLYPEQLAKENSTQQIDKRKFEKIVERQYNSQPVIDFNPTYKRLNNLIEGLTLINHLNRFGKNEVEKWLNGEEVEVKYKAIETSSVQPVKLGYATIKTEKDFIEILETRSTWWDDLFEDVDTYFAIKAWLGSYQNISSRKLFDEMIHFYKPYGKDFVKEAAIRYFQPERDIQIDMNMFNFFTTENIHEEVKKYISKLDDIYKITSFEKVRFYLFQLEFSLKQVSITNNDENLVLVNSIIEKISSAFGCIPENFDSRKTQIQDKFTSKNKKESYINLLKLFYSFFKARIYKDTKNRKFDDINEIALSYANDEALFVDKYCNAELTVYLKNKQLNYIQQKDFSEFLFSVFHEHIKSNLSVENIEFSEKKAIVFYKFSKSLTEFFSSQGINRTFVSKGDDKNVELQTKLIPSGEALYSNLIAEICKNHSVNEQSFEKESLVKAKSSIYSITKIYKQKKKKEASIFSTGMILYSFPAIGSLIGIIVLLFMPESVLKYLGLFESAWMIPGLIGLIYLSICILFIPAILFYFDNNTENLLNISNEDKKNLKPHALVGWIVKYSFLSLIGLVIIGLILMVVVGIGSIFFDYETDPTVDAIHNFLAKLSTFVVFYKVYLPLNIFYKHSKNETKIVKHYITRKVFTYSMIIIIVIFTFLSLSDINLIDDRNSRRDLPTLETQKPLINYYVVTTEVANIRSGPSTDYPVIGQVKKNDKVEFIGEYKDWKIIKYNNQKAYIYSSLIKKIK